MTRRTHSRINPLPPNSPITIEEYHLKRIRIKGLRDWLIEELTKAFFEARQNKTKTFNEHSFEVSWPDHIIRLADTILEHYYKPGSSITFIVFDPMIREIFAAPFLDRVVHHLLYHVSAKWWDDRFIKDSYSCREGKGTLYGIKRLQATMRKATDNGTKPAYIIKLDIKGCFMSLSRKKLLETVKEGLYEQFCPYYDEYPEARALHKLLLNIWTEVIMDDPIQDARRRGNPKDWELVPHDKSLYWQPPGFGIVIGNLTSQLLSNIYLSALDKFVTETLGYEWYGRYVDDFYIIVSKEDFPQALKDIKLIEKFLKDELLLTLHPKKRYIQPVSHGVSFLGARVYLNCLYPSDRLQSKFVTALKGLSYGQRDKEAAMISYLGMFQHFQSAKFIKKVFRKFGVDFALYREWCDTAHRRRAPDIVADIRAQAMAHRRRVTGSGGKVT